MRRLFPDPADEVDLDAAYAWPTPEAQLVRANMVISADGAAAYAGSGRPLTTRADQRVFAALRGLADVVLVGAGTVRRENYGPVRPTPQRQARRVAAGRSPVPPLAVVSARLDLDPQSRFFAAAVARPLVLTCATAPADRRTALGSVADVLECGTNAVDIPSALAALAERGHRRVLCEGGPTLLGAIMAAGRLAELCVTVAPTLVGGGGARMIAGAPLPELAALQLRQVLEDEGSLFLRYAVPP